MFKASKLVLAGFLVLLTAFILPSAWADSSETVPGAAVEEPIALNGSSDSDVLTPETEILEWTTRRMISWSPPGRSFIPEAKETPEEGRARYALIARAMVDVVYDPDEAPAFPGKRGRARTLAMMLSIAWHESGFRKDVDLGEGKLSRGDSGRSWCLIQAQLGSPGPDGKTSGRIVFQGKDVVWTTATALKAKPLGLPDFGGEDLVNNREACVRAGLRMARKSLSGCRKLPFMERLAGLSGSCDRGRKESKSRMFKAVEWVSSDPPPADDSAVISSMFPKGKQAPVKDGSSP